MKKGRLAIILVAIAFLFSLSTLFIRYKDYNGCNGPSSPLAGISYCEAYGPAEFQGWPIRRKIFTQHNKQLSENRLGAEEGDYNRELGFIVFGNFLFYLAIITIVSFIFTIGKRSRAHNRH